MIIALKVLGIAYIILVWFKVSCAVTNVLVYGRR